MYATCHSGSAMTFLGQFKHDSNKSKICCVLPKEQKACFFSNLLAWFLFLRQYQPNKASLDIWLSHIYKKKCTHAKVHPWRYLMKIPSFTAVSSVCVIYHNLLILLFIIVIKLISNIISNFNTYIYASVVCLISKYYEMFASKPSPLFCLIKWVHSILNFVNLCLNPINHVV